MNKAYVGDGKVELIAGGGKVYTDIAARFVRSERTLKEIIASDYSKELVKRIINSGHEAAVEFDFFIFGIEGYARVTEVQLVRKRLASYMIKSGRAEKSGRRSFDIVIPDNIEGFTAEKSLPVNLFKLKDGSKLDEYLPAGNDEVILEYGSKDIFQLVEEWYNTGVDQGLPEEDLRYVKPQATEFKALIGMNAHALRDWFRIRCCKNAQREIRDLALKMLNLCKESAPDLFADAGPNCVRLGYCPENELQHEDCRGKIMTKNEAIKLIKEKMAGN
ncbi:FAD-dependent thymidylate synthase [Halocella sp. SP3-1]|uniref:FAD-dependent thymidylate synthase n=1 Tax=Halocella sp. SP3-1 TaxID=2382161 RepID=UPI000F764E8D|nr:FAD-dependent thymidylate synthase [Halocella sp. SP3-1]AZO96564.1 FAD-dependent thymidylate synthase [Halocella sp. SP3-1]